MNEKIHAGKLRNAQRKFQKDPILYFDKVLGVEAIEDYQRKVIKAIWENDRVAIRACHDLGKTWIMARVAMAFLNVFPKSKVITTAPTHLMVERLLWSEIRGAHLRAKIPLGGQLNMTSWTIDPEWFALGFTPKTQASGDEGQGTQSTFQGFHAPYILILFDEATGIPANIWTMAEGLMTSANVKFVAIGNPTSKNCEFYNCFRQRNWAKVSLSCFDSPNLIANGITTKEKLMEEVGRVSAMNDTEALSRIASYKVTRPYLLTTKWVIESILKWGIDHPLTVSKVLGEFPDSDSKALINLLDIERAQIREYEPTEYDRRCIGIDPGGDGADSTVMTALHGKKQLGRLELRGEDSVEVSGKAIAWSKEIWPGKGADIFVVDKTGVGYGTVSILEHQIGVGLSKNCEIRGVHFGSACEDEKDKEMYCNTKARMFGLLRDDLKKNDGLSILNESIYAEELTTIRKNHNEKGQLAIESKEQYKKRTGRKSPDSSDSLALANFGRYDELKVGRFGKETDSDKAKAKTLAGGLNSKRNW